MTKLRTDFFTTNNKRDYLLGLLRKAHRDLARAGNDHETRRKALLAID